MKQVIDIKNCTMEKVSSAILFIMGTVFLFLAIFDGWMYLLITVVSYAAGILVNDLDEGDYRKGRP